MLAMISTAASASAQEQINPLQEGFFSSAKMPVVVTVATIILVGIFVFLSTMERRLKKLERELEKR